MAIYRFTVSCIGQRDKLCLLSAAYLDIKRCLERMYDLNETMKH